MTKRFVRALALLALIGLFAVSMFAQTAPQAIPSTDTIVAGSGVQTQCTAITGGGGGATLHANCPGDGGQATNAAVQLYLPTAVAVDSAGNLYIAEQKTDIRKVDPSGIITTFAGGFASFTPSTCTAGSSNIGDGCPANEAYLNGVRGLAIAPVSVTGSYPINAGDVFLMDTSAKRLRRIDHTTYLMSSVVKNSAGVSNGTVAAGATGTGSINSPRGMNFDSKSHLYIADTTGNVISVIDFSAGTIATVVNTAKTGSCVLGSTAGATTVSAPADVSADADGNIYFTACNLVYEVKVNSSTGMSDQNSSISIVAGNGSTSGGTTGYQLGTSAVINAKGVRALPNGDLYIGDGTHIWFYDHNTKYVHAIVTGLAGGVQSSMGLDAWGNLYYPDSSSTAGGYIHKLSLGTNFASSAAPQNVTLHFGVNDFLSSITNAANFSFGACASSGPNADTTEDCITPVTYDGTAGTLYQTATVTGQSGSIQLPVTNQANPVCQLPSAASQTVDIAGSGSTSVTLEGNLGSACQYAETFQHVLSCAVKDIPQHGSVICTGMSCSYTPGGSPVNDSFTYTCTDTSAMSTGSVLYDGGASSINLPESNPLVSTAATVTLNAPVVTSVNTTTVVTPSASSVAMGNNVTLLTTVTATGGSNAPTGNVTFTVDGVDQAPVALTPGAGIASTAQLVVSAPALGSHSVSVSYAGVSGSFNTSSGTSSFSVVIPNTMMSVNPTSLTFPATTVGLGASNQMVTFTNNSTVGVTVTPTTSGPFGVWYNWCSGTIAPGASCTVFIGYVPATAGAEAGTLTFAYSNQDAPLTVSLSGTGVSQITVSTSALTFAPTNIGMAPGAQTVAVVNRTGSTVTVTPSITGSFWISTNGCTSSLAPNTGCYLWVNYYASAAGQQTGTLTVTPSVGSAATVSLTGTGNAGDINLSTSALTFATTTVGRAPGSQTITIANKTGSAITITPSITGSFWVSTNGCTGTIAANAGCTLWVNYYASVVGQQTGTLTVTPSVGTVHTVSLTGTGQ